MVTALIALAAFFAGMSSGLLRRGAHSGNHRVSDPAEREPQAGTAGTPSSGYCAEQRARDAEHLNLLDEFCTLQRLRLAVIKRAEQAGDLELLEGSQMIFLKTESVRCLEKIIVLEPSGFYRQTYDELLAELQRSAGTPQ